MPIYEYQCPVCGHIQEEICKSTDKPETIGCAYCGEAGSDQQMIPIMSVGSFVVKGFNESNGYSGGQSVNL